MRPATYADRQAWREIIRWPDDCEEAFDGTMPKSEAGVRFHSLDDRRFLAEITCTHGAYQGYQLFAIVEQTDAAPRATLLSFETFEDDGNGGLTKSVTQEMWGLPEFEPRTKLLTILNKYRGPGDCGSLGTYAFQDGTPVLRELRVKLECDGKGAESPRKWKSIEPR